MGRREGSNFITGFVTTHRMVGREADHTNYEKEIWFDRWKLMGLLRSFLPNDEEVD
jgi:hypothetical protein